MPNELISVIDIAHIHGKRKQSIFKLLKRRGIEQVKAPGEGARGQAISYISQHDYEQLQPELSSIESDLGRSVEAEPTPGSVLPHGSLSPNTIRGASKSALPATSTNAYAAIARRLLSANSSRLGPASHSGRINRDTTAMCAGYERLYTEVFRASSLEEVELRCNRFFAVMPDLSIS